ncbi:hypothetical protein Efla_004981 [Eimeria flavescens]
MRGLLRRLARNVCLFVSFNCMLTGASDSQIVRPPEQGPPPPSGSLDVHYEAAFELPDNGEDPFSRVSFLRANAVVIRDSDVTGSALRDLATLVGLLIREEAHHVQLQNDLKHAGETKKALDLLLTNPALLPTTEYGLHENEEGALLVRVRRLVESPCLRRFSFAEQREVPYWMVDSESPLLALTQDLMRDVLGVTLPESQLVPPDARTLPIEFGYDTTKRRIAHFTFGDSFITLQSSTAFKPETGGSTSHGFYNISIAGGNRADPNATPETPTVENTVPVPQIPRIRVGDVNVVQSPPSQSPATLATTFRDFNLKLISDPEAKKHGAEANMQNFGIGVTRDFDDRINSITRKSNQISHFILACKAALASEKIGPYSVKLDTDLADDRHHGYSAKVTSNTPQTGEVVFGGGFDQTNHPTSAITLQSSDMSIAFNGSKEKSDYKVRIGPFLFDVVVTGGMPDFILRDVLI